MTTSKWDLLENSGDGSQDSNQLDGQDVDYSDTRYEKSSSPKTQKSANNE